MAKQNKTTAEKPEKITLATEKQFQIDAHAWEVLPVGTVFKLNKATGLYECGDLVVTPEELL